MKITNCLLLAFLVLSSCSQEKNKLSLADDAITSFILADEFQIELFAAEPLISDPVAMEVDEDGNVYVVEMHGYPLDITGSGFVKFLADTDGDGKPDKSTVFADSLILPTGIMRWKKGVLVVDPPHVLYLEDKDGDGVADVREIVLTGFALSNPQHNTNTPIYGLDNWLYLANESDITPKVYQKEFGDKGSNVRYMNNPAAPQLPSNADGRNVRFKPETHELEMLSGDTQFGHTFSIWGHHLGTSNAHHLFHEVVQANYLRRNPSLLVADVTQLISDHGDAAEIFPVTDTPQHQLLTDVGVITSSCGVTWYTGGLFPEKFNQVTFIAEPVHNLVHADYITDKGASFTASRVYEKKEFLASKDSWSRMVNFYIGPDGALYAIDYYRQYVEHPEWMSEEVAASGALYNGSDKGRIYRITPKGTSATDWCNKINLGKSSTTELIGYLSNKNSWWRRNAQRLLVDRKDNNTTTLLTQWMDTTRSDIGFVHGLWVLEGLKEMKAPYISKGLQHTTPGVRENAIRIAELYLEKYPDLLHDLLPLAGDDDPKVRFQLLCTLGFVDDPKAVRARQAILQRDLSDDWVHIAALSASPGNEITMIENFLKNIPAVPNDGIRKFFINTSAVIGLSENSPGIEKLINLATKNISTGAWWKTSLLEGLLKGVRELEKRPTVSPTLQAQLIASFNGQTDKDLRKISIQLLEILPTARTTNWNNAVTSASSAAVDTSADIHYRSDALRLLGMDGDMRHVEIFKKLLTPAVPEPVQTSALSAYASTDYNACTQFLLTHWQQMTPAIRDEAIITFMKSSSGMHRLLDAIDNNRIQSTALKWPQMVRLMNSYNDDIRKKAREVLTGGLDDRDEALEAYKKSLTLSGNAVNGQKIFEQSCASCHQIGNTLGTAFGPDLASIRNRDPQFILMDIINPNRSIADGYELWSVNQSNGETVTGIISSETSSTITLRFASGEEITISRQSIRTLESLETSAMPAGLEKSMSLEQMADLLAFLRRGLEAGS